MFCIVVWSAEVRRVEHDVHVTAVQYYDLASLCHLLFFKETTAYEMRISDWSFRRVLSRSEPVRIVEAEAPAKRYGGGAASGADEQADAPAHKSVPRRETPVPVVLTRHAAQNLYAPLRTVEPVAGNGRGNLPRGLALDTLLPTLPVPAGASAAWHLDGPGVTDGPLPH